MIAPTLPPPTTPGTQAGVADSTRLSRRPSGSGGAVLLVDDEPLSGMILGTWLVEMGYQVQTALSPTAADGLLQSDRFDLLLSDVCMPGNFRLEWIERLLQNENHPPILLMTGTPDIETACRAANLPIAGYLLKPLDFSAVDTVMQRILTEHRGRREFLDLAQEIAGLFKAKEIDRTPEENSLVDRLAELSRNLRPSSTRLPADQRSAELWRTALLDTIAVIERTKHSFRSKELGALRQRLQLLLRRGEPT